MPVAVPVKLNVALLGRDGVELAGHGVLGQSFEIAQRLHYAGGHLPGLADRHVFAGENAGDRGAIEVTGGQVEFLAGQCAGRRINQSLVLVALGDKQPALRRRVRSTRSVPTAIVALADS